MVSLRACAATVVESLERRQLLSAPPNGPYGLVATATGATSVEVQFIDNASDETGFVVERTAVGGGGSTPVLFNVPASPGVGQTVTYVDQMASPSTAYEYRAYAVNPAQSSIAGPADVLTPATGSGGGGGGVTNPGGAPNGPYGLTATATSPTSVSLLFTDYATNETGLAIERAASAAGPYVRVATLPANGTSGQTVSYVDTSAAAGTTYFYRAFAVNGPYQSSVNGPVSVTTPQVPPANPGSAPNGPYGLVATQATTTSVSLAFTDYATNETGFIVERSSSQNGPFVPLATLPSSAGTGGLVTYTDAGLQQFTTYWYRVYAVNGAYASSVNGPISVTTAAVSPVGPGLPNLGGPPNGPYGLQVTAGPTNYSATNRPASVSFIDNATNETGFEVQFATSPNGPWGSLGFAGPQAGSGQRVTVNVLPGPLQPGTTYYIRVLAVNGPYESSIAGPVAFTPATNYLSPTFAYGVAFERDSLTARITRTAYDATSGYFYTLAADPTFGAASTGGTIERWNATTGLLDDSFAGGTGRLRLNDVSAVPFGRVTGIAVQSDGKLIVAGNPKPSASGDIELIRINRDGTLDATFNNGAGVQDVTENVATNEEDFVQDVAVDASDRIYVGGEYRNNTSSGRDFFAARFTANGQIDPTFGAGGSGIVHGTLTDGATAQAGALAVDTDGSVIVVGERLAGPNVDVFGERMNPDGSVNDAFALPAESGTGQGAIAQDVLIQADHKVVVSGFLGYTAFATRRNADGTADPTWVGFPARPPGLLSLTQTNFAGITRLADGAYFAVGTSYDEAVIDNATDAIVAKLRPDGSLDPSFGDGGVVRSDFGGGDGWDSVFLAPDGNPIAAGTLGGTAGFAKYKVS